MGNIQHIVLKLKTIMRVFFEAGSYYGMLIISWGRRAPINWFDKRIYSQNGEDGIIQFIFHKIGCVDKFFVEIGAGDGLQCNSRLLKRLGWQGIQIDVVKNGDIKQHFVNVENVEKLLKKYKVPNRFDLLSIDIDGNDFWIWKAITVFKPRVIVIEYNGMLGPKKNMVMPYNKRHVWDGSDYFGASLGALVKLGKVKGYQLIGTNKTGVNAFFVEKEAAQKYFIEGKTAELYHTPGYALYPKSSKKFIKG